MIKYIAIITTALFLTSCGPQAGENVYVGVQGMPNTLGEVVARNSESLVVKLCDGTSYKVSYRDVVVTTDLCETRVRE